MKAHVIHATCDSGHEERLRVARAFEWVESLASLLDGTSPFYVNPPADESMIGKCGICGSPIHCTVEKEPEEVTP